VEFWAMAIKFGKVLGAALFALAITAGSARAVPVTFNFYGGNGQQSSSFNFTKSGITLSVSSNKWDDSGVQVSSVGKVGRWSNGLGILSGASGDEHFIDGKKNGSTANELMKFYFSKAVNIISITFSYNDSDDDFAFFFDKNSNGSLAGDLVWKTRDIPGSSFYGSYTFAALESRKYIGQLFGIGAFENNDNFKIASITVNDRPSAVPLPGALPLLLSAFGGVLWTGIRRKQKTVT
jgi:hypothetical protein